MPDLTKAEAAVEATKVVDLADQIERVKSSVAALPDKDYSAVLAEMPADAIEWLRQSGIYRPELETHEPSEPPPPPDKFPIEVHGASLLDKDERWIRHFVSEPGEKQTMCGLAAGKSDKTASVHRTCPKCADLFSAMRGK